SALSRRRPVLDAGIVVMAGALGDRESEHRALVLDVDGRVCTNVARSADAPWDGWSVLAESAFPA
ncbi:MAG: hypothetical protein M3154_08450, partial [Candidatus Eremiobacteraeota bacterium]|nr:hypothetical protein [Candidatus Eremiobacteraeota bacterium]